MILRPRCAYCRRAFTPNYRNRSKTEHLQRYCGLEACRKASLQDSQRRYRRKEPELLSKVRDRVRTHRDPTRTRGSEQTASLSRASFQGAPEAVSPDILGVSRQGEEVLAELVRQLFVHFPVVAERVAGEGCNANAAGTFGLSRTGISG
jgi:hypothetical protein